MRYDAYENLVYEFYSSHKLRTDAQDNILDYTMNFILRGESHSVTLEKLVEWLEFDCEGMVHIPSTFNQTDAWIELGGRENYYLHTSKSTKLENTTYKVLH